MYVSKGCEALKKKTMYDFYSTIFTKICRSWLQNSKLPTRILIEIVHLYIIG